MSESESKSKEELVNLKRAVTHEWDWWAYQFRVHHRQGIEGIDYWDEQLIMFATHVLDLQPGQRLLDLACGSGVHAIRFAQQGLDVVGLDISTRLIQYCREQAVEEGVENVTFVEGDMRDLTYKEEFDALVVLSTSFGFFDDETNQRVLNSIARALKPGGQVLLELADFTNLACDHQQYKYWQERPEGIYWTETWFDPITWIRHGVFRFTDNDGVTHLWDDHERVRVYPLPELRRMLNQAGLEITEVYGDIMLPPRPYGEKHHRRMNVVGRRPPDAP